MSSFFTEAWKDLHLSIGQILFQQIDSDVRSRLRVDLIHVEVDDVICDLLVKLSKSLISNNENGIETRKN